MALCRIKLLMPCEKCVVQTTRKPELTTCKKLAYNLGGYPAHSCTLQFRLLSAERHAWRFFLANHRRPTDSPQSHLGIALPMRSVFCKVKIVKFSYGFHIYYRKPINQVYESIFAPAPALSDQSPYQYATAGHRRFEESRPSAAVRPGGRYAYSADTSPGVSGAH